MNCDHCYQILYQNDPYFVCTNYGEPLSWSHQQYLLGERLVQQIFWFVNTELKNNRTKSLINNLF